MRLLINTVPMDGIVVIGEGEKDEAPMLFNGEEIGDGSPPRVDIAVDPLEGTTLCARGLPGALAVIALAERGAMFDPGPCFYMEKLVGGPEIADCLSLEEPIGDVVQRVAKRRGVSPTEITTVILDRERHAEGVRQIREAGSRIRFITDGDVSAALLAVMEGTGVDLLWGIGGTPEGVISAAAIKCLGGQILGRLWPRNDEERKAAEDAGYEIERVLDGRRARRRQRRVLRRQRRHRRRPPPGGAVPQRRASRRPSRWSCAPAPARCAGSAAVTTRSSCARLPAAFTGSR